MGQHVRVTARADDLDQLVGTAVVDGEGVGRGARLDGGARDDALVLEPVTHLGATVGVGRLEWS